MARLKSTEKYVICMAIIVFLIFLHTQFKNNKFSISISGRTKYFFEIWNSCVTKKFLTEDVTADEFWKSFEGGSKECDIEARIPSFLKTIGLQNKDEKKFAMLPVQNSSKNVFVTLGVGLDTTAEKQFQKVMREAGHNVTFYGADPIVEGNSKIYSEIGKFFPFAVGAQAGYSDASVLLNGVYKTIPVVYVDIVYFIAQVLKEKIIDNLWMDTEFAEYDVFDIFYRGGSFDQNDITFCQISLEVHRPSKIQKEQFMKFAKRIVEEKRFGFFYTKNMGHMRMWLFNFASDYCLEKFLD